jgi:hypothetical protein
MSHKNQIRGSVLENYNVFQYNWHHCDDFSNFGPVYEQNNNNANELIAGMPLGNIPLTWTFVGNSMNTKDDVGTVTNLQYQHYTWLVYTKKLTFSARGVQVE